MLKTGLSHGVAIMPNAPKERYSDPVTYWFLTLPMFTKCNRVVIIRKEPMVLLDTFGLRVGFSDGSDL